jgi:ABC-type phosphate transport system permease subunit
MSRRLGLKTFVKIGIPSIIISLYGTYVLANILQAKYDRYDRQTSPQLDTVEHPLFHSKPFDLNEELKVNIFSLPLLSVVVVVFVVLLAHLK